MSPEDRARIARENGSKSRGPVTPEGKAKVAANAIKTGKHIKSESLAHFLPPHHAVLSNEDRAFFNRNLQALFAIYQPLNQLAAGLVQDIAIAKFQIARYQNFITVQSNLAPLTAETIARAIDTLPGRNSLAPKVSREIGFLRKSIAFLEKQLAYIYKTFPNAARSEPRLDEKQTQPVVAKKELSGNDPAALDSRTKTRPAGTGQSRPKKNPRRC